MPEKPVLHGRDHRVGGADPIPGLGTGGGYPWAYYGLLGLGTPASGTTAYTDTTNGYQWTSDSTIFGVGVHTYTGSGSATKQGPVIFAKGLYRWTVTLGTTTSPLPTGACVLAFDRLDFAFSTGWGSSNHMQDGVVWFSRLAGNDGSATGIAQIFSVFNNTGSAFTAGISGSCFIEQISTFVPSSGTYPPNF